jgi:hypothetical protein
MEKPAPMPELTKIQFDEEGIDVGTILHAGRFVNVLNQCAAAHFDFGVASRARLWLNFSRNGIRSRHRAGNPRPAQNQIQDVVWLREPIWFRTEHQRLPRLPRHARRAARAE